MALSGVSRVVEEIGWRRRRWWWWEKMISTQTKNIREPLKSASRSHELSTI
jgi:hypothetical protein